MVGVLINHPVLISAYKPPGTAEQIFVEFLDKSQTERADHTHHPHHPHHPTPPPKKKKSLNIVLHHVFFNRLF